MAKKKGNAQAVYNSAGISLSDGDETGLFVDSTGSLLVAATIPANSSVNVAQINGVTPLMGNGVSGTGALRVSLASDSTGNIATIGTSVTPGTAASNLGKAEDAVHTSGDVGVMDLGVSNEAQSNLNSADGDYTPKATDRKGNTFTNMATTIAGENISQDVLGVNHKPVASSVYTGTGFMAQLNDVDISVKASAGNILSVTASNINAAARYLQVHNKASAPASGEAPVFSFVIPAGTAAAPAVREVGREFFGEHGHYLSAGVAIGISTVAATFTAATTTDHTVNGTYV